MSISKSDVRHQDIVGSIRAFRYIRVDEAVYLLAVLVYFVQAFIDTTMINPVLADSFLPALKAISFSLVALKIAISSFSSSIFRIFFAICLLVFSFFTILVGGYAAPFQFLIMVVGAADVNFDRIAKIYLWSSITLTVITIGLALLGVIQNVSVPRGDAVVYSYGFYYSTEFSAHVLCMAIAWIYVHRDRLTMKVYLPVLIVAILTFILTDGRLSFFLTMLIVPLVFVEDRRRNAVGPDYCYPKWMKMSFIIMAFISLVLMIVYRNASILGLLNKLLTNRLYYAHLGYMKYGITLFGQQIEMISWGGGRTVWAENYFYLDNSYVNILLRFGLVTLLMAVIICSLPFYRLRSDAGVVAVLIFAVAAASFVNEHLMSLSYNFFSLMAFAKSSDFLSRRSNFYDSLAHFDSEVVGDR